ncbi:MAG TPA: hypothetical protein VM597_30650 [Gemmataceae bacterium]|nr:hypothetical protein [Gemmataceae bacterium]
MFSRPLHIVLAVLLLIAGVVTTVLFASGLFVPGVLGVIASVGLLGAWVNDARRPSDWPSSPGAATRPASAPPDGHLRFTLVVEGLEPDRIAGVWTDLCRPDRPPAEDVRQLFQNFTVVEGRRFRFRDGDPTATAALLTHVLGTAAGVPVRTTLEPAAERTPPWS